MASRTPYSSSPQNVKYSTSFQPAPPSIEQTVALSRNWSILPTLPPPVMQSSFDIRPLDLSSRYSSPNPSNFQNPVFTFHNTLAPPLQSLCSTVTVPNASPSLAGRVIPLKHFSASTYDFQFALPQLPVNSTPFTMAGVKTVNELFRDTMMKYDSPHRPLFSVEDRLLASNSSVFFRDHEQRSSPFFQHNWPAALFSPTDSAFYPLKRPGQTMAHICIERYHHSFSGQIEFFDGVQTSLTTPALKLVAASTPQLSQISSTKISVINNLVSVYHTMQREMTRIGLESLDMNFGERVEMLAVVEENQRISAMAINDSMRRYLVIPPEKPFARYRRPSLLQSPLFFPAGSSDSLEPFKPQRTALIGRADQSSIGYVCGIGNSYKTTYEGGACLYDTLGQQFAVQPHWVHQEGVPHGLSTVILEKKYSEHPNIPRAFLCDPLSDIGEVDAISLFRYGSQKAGHVCFNRSIIHEATAYQREVLLDKAKKILEQNNPKLKQLYVTFSNGGYPMNEALKQLSPEYRNTVLVITVGTTTIIDKDRACKVYNIIGTKDLPSKMCNGGEKGILAAKEKAEIEMVPQTEAQFGTGGHYFLQSDYQKKIRQIIKEEIMGEYEIE